MKPRTIDWDEDYRNGHWEGFGDKDQLARYVSLGGVIRMAGVKTLLDVGCGLGLLRYFLLPGTIRAYTGIDISQVALDQIPAPQPHERFICARVEEWEPTQTYEGIVLNEVLYYFEDPEAALVKMHRCLVPGGVLIVSIYRHPSWRSPNRRVLKQVRRFFAAQGYSITDDLQITTLTNGEKTWSILAGRTQSPGARP